MTEKEGVLTKLSRRRICWNQREVRVDIEFGVRYRRPGRDVAAPAPAASSAPHSLPPESAESLRGVFGGCTINRKAAALLRLRLRQRALPPLQQQLFPPMATAALGRTSGNAAGDLSCCRQPAGGHGLRVRCSSARLSGHGCSRSNAAFRFIEDPRITRAKPYRTARGKKRFQKNAQVFDRDGRIRIRCGATNLSDGLGICAAYRGAAARTGAGIVEARARPLPLRGRSRSRSHIPIPDLIAEPLEPNGVERERSTSRSGLACAAAEQPTREQPA